MQFDTGDAGKALKINPAGGPAKAGGPPFNAVGMPSAEINRRIAALSPTITLSFSCGKDSVASLIELRRYNFERIIPIHYYTVPGLSFVEETLTYYEQFFGLKIIRVPGPGVYRMMRETIFQDPVRATALERIDDINPIPDFTFEEIRTAVCEDYGLPTMVYNATGVRSADSPRRAMFLKKTGAVHWDVKRFDCIYDWRIARVLDEIRSAKVKLTQEYHTWKRSFEGLAYHMIVPLARHYPEDYAKLREWFPMIDLQVFRYEIAEKKGWLGGQRGG